MIYLDHNATTPVRPEVVEAMLPHFSEEWGNPSSSYRFGSRLKKTLETAREQVADLIGAHPVEIVFTSGGTLRFSLGLTNTAEEIRETIAAVHSAAMTLRP